MNVIAFDADDTLWDCQSHFERIENELYALIAPYCDNPARELYQTEAANMADLGYGCKAFTISIIETALRVGASHLQPTALSTLLAHSKALLHLPATPLPGVRETLETIRKRIDNGEGRGKTVMAVFTKGELQDQENKLKRSGLLGYFDHVEITSDKTEHEFSQLCRRLHTEPGRLLMVGNSFKSDIAPALAIGAWAVHIPFHVTWQLEQFANEGGTARPVEEFDHERLRKIGSISQLADLCSF